VKNFLFLIIFLALPFNFSEAEHIDTLDKMPILQALPEGLRGYSPEEQRDEKYRKFLSPSVKILVDGASGSGTIIYYDSKNNIAYVASCGHLWSKGVMSAEQSKLKNKKCNVVVYYHNNKKLDKPKSYNADVLFYSYMDSLDTSLVAFSPDWSPNYFPIAPLDYKYQINSIAHSCGCDHGSEVAHYSVVIKEAGADIITEKNGPRPGRSGGGLMDDNGYYIGTCHSTQFIDGSGKGYFTTLSDIHKFWGKQKGYEFLLNQKPKKSAGQLLPIKDKNDRLKTYSPDYILLP
jgi:hypothetical protein